MINMGNDYAVAYADMVTNMDLEGTEYSIIDKKIPFYQLAIHGYVNYTGEALNLTQNTQNELLNSAEYGAGLAFTFMKESAFELQNTLYTEYFGADYSAWHDEMPPARRPHEQNVRAERREKLCFSLEIGLMANFAD